MTVSVAAVTMGEEAPADLSDHTVVPEAVFAGPRAFEQAIASASDWLWLLAPGARPQPDALGRLIDNTNPPGEAPAVLLAGMVRDSAGRAVSAELPAGDEGRLTDVVRLTGQRLLPIRNATFANCLVARDCFARYGLPDSFRFDRFAPIEWSARVLREEPGYFVASSVVVVSKATTRSGPPNAALFRMLRTGAWNRGEAMSQLRDAFSSAYTASKASAIRSQS